MKVLTKVNSEVVKIGGSGSTFLGGIWKRRFRGGFDPNTKNMLFFIIFPHNPPLYATIKQQNIFGKIPNF